MMNTFKYLWKHYTGLPLAEAWLGFSSHAITHWEWLKVRGPYVHKDIDDSLDFDKVKAMMLRKYDMNSKTYKQWFPSFDFPPDETPKELYACLKELYGKWINAKVKLYKKLEKS